MIRFNYWGKNWCNPLKCVPESSLKMCLSMYIALPFISLLISNFLLLFFFFFLLPYPFKISIMKNIPASCNNYLNGEFNSTARMIVIIYLLIFGASTEGWTQKPFLMRWDLLLPSVYKKHLFTYVFLNVRKDHVQKAHWFFYRYKNLCDSITIYYFWKVHFIDIFPFYHFIIIAFWFSLHATQILLKPYSVNVVNFKCFNVLFDIPTGPISCAENTLFPIYIFSSQSIKR